jgi:hypothetical protein
MDTQNGDTAWTCLMDVQYEHATRTCSLDTQHGFNMDEQHGNTVWTWTCNTEKRVKFKKALSLFPVKVFSTNKN